jgi:HEPN domain-containing protein
VDSAQLAVENAAKVVLALAGRIGRTHNPATQIRRLINEGQFGADFSERLERLAELAELLGSDIHIQTDYGDEAGGRTPWELFDEEDARQALLIAGEAVSLADRTIAEISP